MVGDLLSNPDPALDDPFAGLGALGPTGLAAEQVQRHAGQNVRGNQAQVDQAPDPGRVGAESEN